MFRRRKYTLKLMARWFDRHLCKTATCERLNLGLYLSLCVGCVSCIHSQVQRVPVHWHDALPSVCRRSPDLWFQRYGQ
ncbi:hypothetical protein SCLCIDRAFT_1223447 [Scleroderma citrinum Foug A]|uniref:Uncharacterized protein n=1 Tax=Scleroderma citrinum Foug A TaxID=1036808 RepID=A0A0C2ZJ54_9AGAM|nr:hypothetical protein SCLCIDRAFT_1223447 [Scleroderma citrinum Foug A]